MAMRRRLWSISALAVELNRDRRTVAKLLDGAQPDGKVRGHDAWYLETVLGALDLAQDPPSGVPPLLNHFVLRLRDWREIHDGDEMRLGIDDMAAALETDRETVVTWLRAGCPYAARGDFEAGDGFQFVPAHVFDWLMLVGNAARWSPEARGALKLGSAR